MSQSIPRRARRPELGDRDYHMQSLDFEAFILSDTEIQPVSLHHHDAYEIYFFLSGNVKYLIENRTYHLVTGDILLVSPVELHQALPMPGVQPYRRMVLYLSPSYLLALDGGRGRFLDCFAPTASSLLRLEPTVSGQLFQLAMQIANEAASVYPRSGTYNTSQAMAGGDLYVKTLSRGDEFSYLMADAQVRTLLVRLNRLIRSAQTDNSQEMRSTRDISAAVAYINEHLNEALSLDILSERLFMNKYHLSRKFKDQIGTTVHRYIVQRRLILSKQLMLSGLSPFDVYQECGFSDYSSFYRAFKSEYNISPRTFFSMNRQVP